LNGTLFAKPEVSIAREEPGAKNDAAWAQYEEVLTHVLTREQILKLGKNPETVARFDNDYWGMGDDAYMVQMDVMHVSIFFRLHSGFMTLIERSKFTALTCCAKQLLRITPATSRS
jgi:hypothetical protein